MQSTGETGFSGLAWEELMISIMKEHFIFILAFGLRCVQTWTDHEKEKEFLIVSIYCQNVKMYG
jgi:hypothetical protein